MREKNEELIKFEKGVGARVGGGEFKYLKKCKRGR